MFLLTFSLDTRPCSICKKVSVQSILSYSNKSEFLGCDTLYQNQETSRETFQVVVKRRQDQISMGLENACIDLKQNCTIFVAWWMLWENFLDFDIIDIPGQS